MASGDTKTNQYLDIAAHGTRSDLQRGCCNTRTQDLIMDVAERIITEEETRAAADRVLQSEIDEIRNNPDVYDIVATYADLQNYDTSTITDKDVIRVLRDETHDNASTYYRWDAADQEFDYIGEAGDYYTKAQADALLSLKADKATTYTKTEVDTLLDGKQDELTAGDNVAIEDESGALVISATDTTYSNFTGTDGTAAGTAGLVPAPAASDVNKYLKSDGTWDLVGSDIRTLTSADVTGHSENYGDYVEAWKLESGAYYKEAGTSFFVSVYLVPDESDPTADPDPTQDAIWTDTPGIILVNNQSPTDPAGSTDVLISSPEVSYVRVTTSHTDGELLDRQRVPEDFVGSYSGGDGQAGLVPAPTIADENSFLKGDGTWSAVGGGGDTVYSTKTTSNANDGGAIYIGNKNASQVVQEDPTVTDNNWKYFWALPTGGASSANAIIPKAGTIDILGAVESGNDYGVAIGFNSQLGLYTGGSVALGFQAKAIGNASDGIAIGKNVTVSGEHGIGIGGGNITIDSTSSNCVAIGYGTSCYSPNCVALGKGAYPTRQGEVNVGCDNTTAFNNTTYRVIGGVHDGQDAHDAATKGQLDSRVIGSLASAPTTSTVGAVGSLLATVESGTGHLYICTDDTGGSYTWQTLV